MELPSGRSCDVTLPETPTTLRFANALQIVVAFQAQELDSHTRGQNPSSSW